MVNLDLHFKALGIVKGVGEIVVEEKIQNYSALLVLFYLQNVLMFILVNVCNVDLVTVITV